MTVKTAEAILKNPDASRLHRNIARGCLKGFIRMGHDAMEQAERMGNQEYMIALCKQRVTALQALIIDDGWTISNP